MAFPGNSQSLPWYLRHTQRWEALNRLSFRSLRSLYIAIFAIFAVYGPYVALTTAPAAPLSLVLLAGILNGLYSVLYPWILIHKPWSLTILVGIGNAILGAGTGTLIAYLSPTFSHLPLGSPTTPVIAGNIIWVLVFVSYFFFVGFIRNQATAAIRIQNELELAHGIQQTLVPPIQSTSALYEIYGVTRPSDRVGGDLVDLISSSDGEIAYVADVAGHGLQAGILMGMLKAAARTALLEPANPAERLPLLLDRLDNVLPAVKESHMYACFAALQLGASGRVRHAIAGHPPVLHYSKETGSFDELKLEQFPLGLIPGSHFSASEVSIAAGDLLLIATDGILETTDEEDQEFGATGLENCVRANAAAPLRQIAANVLETVSAWGKQQDDQTLLIVRCVAHG
jgi:hypothetical protein